MVSPVSSGNSDFLNGPLIARSFVGIMRSFLWAFAPDERLLGGGSLAPKGARRYPDANPILLDGARYPIG